MEKHLATINKDLKAADVGQKFATLKAFVDGSIKKATGVLKKRAHGDIANENTEYQSEDEEPSPKRQRIYLSIVVFFFFLIYYYYYYCFFRSGFFFLLFLEFLIIFKFFFLFFESLLSICLTSKFLLFKPRIYLAADCSFGFPFGFFSIEKTSTAEGD
jgi:hypothetical protein